MVLFCTLPAGFFLLLMNIFDIEAVPVTYMRVPQRSECRRYVSKTVIFYFLIQLKHTCTSDSYNIQILLLILYVYINSLNHTFYAHNAMKDGVFGFVLLKCNVTFSDIFSYIVMGWDS